jgi:hypothetical protein
MTPEGIFNKYLLMHQVTNSNIGLKQLVEMTMMVEFPAVSAQIGQESFLCIVPMNNLGKSSSFHDLLMIFHNFPSCIHDAHGFTFFF